MPAFRGRRYLDDLEAAGPGLVDAVRSGPGTRGAVAAPGVGHRRPAPTGVPTALVEAMEARVRPADDMVVLFTSGSRGAPKGVIHTHGGALRATAAGLDARCVGPGERLYIPMPFFWTGGFAQRAARPRSSPAPPCSPRPSPSPTRTLDLLQRERVTLFRGWPDQAARLAAHPAFAGADLSSLGDGSLGAVLPARPAAARRGRGPNLFGMTETFGPYCGDRLDTDLPAGKCGQLRPAVRRRRGAHRRSRDRAEVRAGRAGRDLWLRGPNLLRGICGRLRSSVFTADGCYRTGDLGRLDDDGYLWYAGPPRRHVQGQGRHVYPSEVEAALRSVDGVRQAHVTDVDGADDRPEVGAVVVTDAPVEAVVAAVRDG